MLAVRVLVRASAVALALALAACGGSSSPTAPATPVAVVPTPTPTPAPTPSPTATPCTTGLCEPPVTSNAPVVRTVLRLYQLFDAQDQWVLPTPVPTKQVVGDPIPLGYTIRLDLTGKDADDHPTNGKMDIDFVYDDEVKVEIAIQSDFQRKVKVLKPGQWSVYAVLDGVASNSLVFTFCDPATTPTCHYP